MVEIYVASGHIKEISLHEKILFIFLLKENSSQIKVDLNLESFFLQYHDNSAACLFKRKRNIFLAHNFIIKKTSLCVTRL